MSNRVDAVTRTVSRYRPGLRWYHWALVLVLHLFWTQPSWGVATNLVSLLGAGVLVYAATSVVRQSQLDEHPLGAYAQTTVGVVIALAGAANVVAGEMGIGYVLVVVGAAVAAWPMLDTVARKAGAWSKRVQSE
jgi:hypothetical protein